MVDSNGATRRLLRERYGRVEASAIPFPVDRYSVDRKEFMSRQTGCDPTVQHKIIKVWYTDLSFGREGSMLGPLPCGHSEPLCRVTPLFVYRHEAL